MLPALALVVAALVSPFIFYPCLVLSLPLAIGLGLGTRPPAARSLALAGFAVTNLPSPPASSDTQPLLGLLLLTGAGIALPYRSRASRADTRRA